jgi:hypothetical protein
MRFSRNARRTISSAVCIPLLVLGAACGNPTAPSNQIDTFTGTLAPPANGVPKSLSFPFTSKTGTVTVTLVSLAPSTTVAVGLAIGTVEGTTCLSLEENQFAVANSIVLQDTLPGGKYCAAIFDVGYITETVTFAFTVEYRK